MVSRTQKSTRNIIFAVCGQFLSIIVGFLARSYFIRFLGNDYQSINALFTSILSFLALSELGIGSAIIVSLYEPLAKRDTERIKSIMAFYKKMYSIIGLSIFVIGLLIMPALPFFSDEPIMNDSNIYIYYFLFLLGSSSTYFYAYKRAILAADQNKYIDTIVHYIFFILLNATQVLLLFLFHNYIVFLIATILSNILENISISLVINKKYLFLSEKAEKISDNDKAKIISDTKGLVFHKLGGTVIGSTDNILISLFVSLSIVGVYSNYLLVVFAVNSVIGQFFQAFTGSLGNLNLSSDNAHKERVFNMIVILNYIISIISSVCMLILFNNFILVWLNNDNFLLTDLQVFLIVGIHIVTGLRRPVLLFKDAFGLFRQDMYKPIAETIVNLVSSMILGYFFGLTGILLGTIISGLLISSWVELYVVYKHGLKSRKIYIYYIYTLLFLFASTVAYYILNTMYSYIFLEVSIVNFIIKAAISIFVSLIVGILFFVFTKHFKIMIKYILQIFKRNKQKSYMNRS